MDWKARADAAMERYASGDDGAFRALHDLLAPRLAVFVFRRSSDPAGVEDLVQQVFLQIHAARAHYCPGSPVMPWAFAIARRLLIDAHRRSKRRSPAEAPADGALEEQPSGEEATDAIVATRRLAARLQEQLAVVPELHRTAFELVQLDGLTMAEAAQRLNTTVTAVKLRSFRAYQVLRERLGDLVREELS
jgi:RNA polymerase sigma-70 factor (ECF subfamily)